MNLSMSDFTKKSIFIKNNLLESAEALCDETGLKLSQVVNLSLKMFFDSGSMICDSGEEPVQPQQFI